MRHFGWIPTVLLLACGGDDGGRSTTTAPSTTVADGTSTDPSLSGSSGDPTTDNMTVGPSTTEGTTTDPSTTADATGATSGTTGGGAAAVLFINFDGADLVGGEDDAPADSTAIPQLEGTWLPIDAGRASTILSGVDELFAPFDIQVTDSRPATGPYTMAVVTASPTPVASAAGLSLSDCDNANDSNVALIFDDPAMGFSPQHVINVVGYQVAVSYGLDPVEGADNDIMSPILEGFVRTFTQRCATLGANAQCTPSTASCNPGEQSSFDEMVARFGEA